MSEVDHMSPSEIIYFSLIGVPVVAAIVLIWFIFRKRKKTAVIFTSVIVIGFASYYAYYPTLKTNTHAKRYEQVVQYLAEKYPNRMFTIVPKQYEVGNTVGDFHVNDRETPKIGVTLRVDKEGQVTQTNWWSGSDHPTQQELWREIKFSYDGPYSLDKKIKDIKKKDEWINGELTAFALTIDNMPAIALFNYTKGGYGLLDLQQGEHEGFIVIENSGYVFLYVDERYQGDTVTVSLENGKEYTWNVHQQKGRLIVQKQQ